MLTINDTAPDFLAMTSEGEIHFHEWMGDAWCILFSHPKDFTPVCTTELGEAARRMPEFEKRGCKLIGLSIDPVDRHLEWAGDIEQITGQAPTFPVIADTDLAVSKLYGMLPSNASAMVGRTAADNATVRSLFVIAPDKSIRVVIAYPMTAGRSFVEILRVLDSLQLTQRAKVATPADWSQGDDVIILPSISDTDARNLFPQGWRAPKPYMRVIPQPR